MQLHGAYIFDGILDMVGERMSKYEQEMFRKLLNSLSYFEVESCLTEEKEYLAEYAVLINLLQRGMPTRLNMHALKLLADIYPEIENTNDEYTIGYDFTQSVKDSHNFLNKVFAAFHIVDPRINRHNLKRNYNNSWEKLGSVYEEMFLFTELPAILNDDSILQLIETQRSVQSISKEYLRLKKIPEEIHNNFIDQRTDFATESVYQTNNELKGIVIEIDGKQHEDANQKYLDTERDHVIASSGWANTVRIKTVDFNNDNIKLKLQCFKEYCAQTAYYKGIRSVYEFNFLKEGSLSHLEICLSPVGIARVQRVLLEYIASGKLSKFKDFWKIAIVERDVPCGYIAIEDLKVQVEKLFAISKQVTPLPDINFEVYSTTEFINSLAHRYYDVKHIDAWDPQKVFNLVIDVSVLQRKGLNGDLRTSNPHFAIIRSSFHIHEDRDVKSAAFINYPGFASKIDDNDELASLSKIEVKNEGWNVDSDTEIVLEYFLQSIFRKKSFRTGQLPIISKALSGNSVIGLLATGGGKSITYQLSTLLQPGITMAVDPIKSLMKDQVDGLKRNYIDSCLYINSTLKGDEKRKALYKVKEGQSQFVFISPERLQMEDFRETLNEMPQKGNYFSFCVVDEAHCVSEWGHDFRTAYLKLGENAIKFCKTKSGKKITLFGLTATASFDVLSDVQRELSGNDEENKLEDDVIVRFESTKRPELQYRVESVSFPTTGISNGWDIKKALGNQKQETILKIIKDAPFHLQEYLDDASICFSDSEEKHKLHKRIRIENYSANDFYESTRNAVLVFCPHTKGHFGVTDRYKVDKDGNSVTERNGYLDRIAYHNPRLKTGFFMGSSSDEAGTKDEIEILSTKHQEGFIANELNLLVATKAFGMGIDKESIRYSVHVNYPGSIESYIQEAGRAGRDGKLAISYILFNEQILELEGKKYEVDLDNNFYFHNNSFKGVSKEMAILDELLQEIYFPDRTFELENIVNQTLELELKIGYWEKDSAKRLYVNKGFKESLGYFDLMTSQVNIYYSVDKELSAKVFDVLNKYIEERHPGEPLYVWIQQSDKQAGIQQILNRKQIGESFSLVVGFRNNGTERLQTITKFLKTVFSTIFTDVKIRQLKENSQGFEGFVESVEQFNLQQTHKFINLKEHCLPRDIDRGLDPGTTFEKFEAYYNGYRDKMDTEKAIFRLSTIGIIDDYTVDFAANTFTIYGIKKKDQVYEKNLREFFLKYYSEKLADTMLKTLKTAKGDTAVEKCLSLLVHFVYREIKKKREVAIKDMKGACLIGLYEGNVAFKEHVDLYFNSKYARKGYSYNDKISGDVVIASITDLTGEGKDAEDINLVWLFMNVVEDDPKAGFIDNIKHLRGACVRLLRSQPDNYIFLLLNAFALYQTSFKIERFLIEAEDLMQKAFLQMGDRDQMDQVIMEEIFNKFVEITKQKNPNLTTWMKKFNLEFDFDQIIISRYIKPLKASSTLLANLNSILSK